MIMYMIHGLRTLGPINWGDMATWVTGGATILLFIVGFWQIRNERISRTKREKETENQKKRSQAELISSWIVAETADKEGPSQWIAIQNQSSQPIYQVIVSVVAVPESGKGTYRGGPIQEDQVHIAIAPPGKGYTTIHSQYGGMFRRPGVEIAFQDAAGNSWVRKAMGELLEIEMSTVGYYNIDLPAGWTGLLPVLPPEIESPWAPPSSPIIG